MLKRILKANVKFVVYVKNLILVKLGEFVLSLVKGDTKFEAIANELQKYYGIKGIRIITINDPKNKLLPKGLVGAYVPEHDKIIINTTLDTDDKFENDVYVLEILLHELRHVMQYYDLGEEFLRKMYNVKGMKEIDVDLHDENELEADAIEFAAENLDKHLHLLRKHRQ